MNTKTLTRVALIAAVYTVISLVLAPLSFGNIQVRFAEALTLLPLIYQPAIAGVTLGCFLTNLIGALMGFNPTGLLDAVIGTAATLIAAIITWRCRNKKVAGLPLISILAPVVLNFFFVGAELAFLLMPENVVWGTLIFGAEVAIGELVAVAVGYLLIGLLSKTKLFTE
ncbi:MAG: QueT transporter family protein [Erysipelotrichaceae bacterium]|nr:QueT transporter family protein [Erysipelotrichaceae bacterium]